MITGLLFGALTRMVLSKESGIDRQSDRSPLLRMNHPIRTVHLLPGRVRFRAPVLVGRHQHAPRVAEAITRIQGVTSAVADARTGSVLITFDDQRLEAEILYAALIRLLDLEKELKKPPMSLARREGTAALSALNKTVFDTTQGLLDLYAVGGILLGAMALNKLVFSHLSLGSLLSAAYITRNGATSPTSLLRLIGRNS